MIFALFFLFQAVCFALALFKSEWLEWLYNQARGPKKSGWRQKASWLLFAPSRGMALLFHVLYTKDTTTDTVKQAFGMD